MSLNSEWHYEPRQVIDHTSEIETTTYGQTHKLSVSGPEKQYTRHNWGKKDGSLWKHNIDGWCCKSLKQNLKQIASQAIYPWHIY